MRLTDAARARIQKATHVLASRQNEANLHVDHLERLEAHAQTALDKIAKDTRLSDEGKKQERARVLEEFRAASAAPVAAMDDLIASVESSYRRRLKLPSLQGDDAQGRLANARHDALLVLDRTPNERLHVAMETLARDPGDVGQLMLSGFAERYLQARESNSAAAYWASKRDDLLAERLGDSARDAQVALGELSDVKAARTILEHHANATAKKLGEPPAVLVGDSAPPA